MRWRDGERGATLVEYVLLVALLAVTAMGAIDLLGPVLDEQYERTA